MPTGWYGTISAICFGQVTKETCAEDERGELWDVHKGECARQAGIVEKTNAEG